MSRATTIVIQSTTVINVLMMLYGKTSFYQKKMKGNTDKYYLIPSKNGDLELLIYMLNSHCNNNKIKDLTKRYF